LLFIPVRRLAITLDQIGLDRSQGSENAIVPFVRAGVQARRRKKAMVEIDFFFIEEFLKEKTTGRDS
jgi:hypothetical protein